MLQFAALHDRHLVRDPGKQEQHFDLSPLSGRTPEGFGPSEWTTSIFSVGDRLEPSHRAEIHRTGPLAARSVTPSFLGPPTELVVKRRIPDQLG